jgi:hypothetical protein
MNDNSQASAHERPRAAADCGFSDSHFRERRARQAIELADDLLVPQITVQVTPGKFIFSRTPQNEPL